MGATYTRQSSYTDGDVIQASDTNNEFDQLLAAFAASSGHTHDGTAGEGGPVTKLLGTSLTIGDGTAGTDITVTYDGQSNDGVMKWMEDEDYFEFSDDILVASTEKLQFRDTAIYINSSADGQLDLVADTEIQIAATTIDINGNVDISGTLTIGSAGISEAELEILDGATVTTTEINILDGNTSIGTTAVSDGHGIVMNHGGTMAQTTVQTLAAYLDDEITAMPNLVTTAATTVGALNSGSITSGFGTIDTGSSTITTTGLITGGSLDIDDVVINGSTIGHTSDTDLMTVASGVLTVAGEVDAVSLDISGDADIAGTFTLNGTTLAETISDTVGAMVTSNTETGITVSYDDADNTLDFVIGTLNQDTTGNAATATALETARTIHGVSFNGTANIDLSEVISDTVGAMFSSNTETGITATYQDADNTIDLVIGAGVIVNSMLADDAVGADELAANAVVTASIVDANVTTAKIADDAVTQAKIADDAVGADQLASDAVVNASIASGASIADSKLATISTAGKVALTALEIDGGTDIGADLTTSDLIVVDDGAAGTNRKAALSRVVTLMSAQGFTTDDPTALAIALG